MNKSTLFWVVIGVLVVGGIGMNWYMKTLPGKYDDLARCLGEKGAVFYGAFWCPHCQEQKKTFGNSEGLLPYAECSQPNGRDRTQICIDKNIESYPTWEFADGSRLTGVQTPEALAEKTQCALPE